jgi:deoxyribodipyrimidine photo-lyase
MNGLYWVRNDLRLEDNLALNAFLNECESGIIIWTPNKSTKRAGSSRRKFQEDSLAHFNESLIRIGQELYVGESDIQYEIEKILHQFPIQKIYFSSLSSIEEKSDEDKIIKFSQKHQLLWESFDQETLIATDNLPFAITDMPFIFSDFRKKVEQSLIIQAPVSLTSKRNTPPLYFHYHHTFTAHPSLLFNGGEVAAHKRLKHYFEDSKAILTYKETRNGMISLDDSSRLSPWLSLGVISARTIIHRLREFEAKCGANESTYWLLFELLWRDYLKFFSRKYGKKIFIEDGVKRGKHYHSIRDLDKFNQWCQGKTYEIFINANMNELNQTGWMSNRGRQNVASFLVHQLKLPWTWGATFFEEQLIDYDCDLNWGNWLYLSGNGSDPRARVFNIKRQAEVYDKDGLYQSKWAT